MHSTSFKKKYLQAAASLSKSIDPDDVQHGKDNVGSCKEDSVWQVDSRMMSRRLSGNVRISNVAYVEGSKHTSSNQVSQSDTSMAETDVPGARARYLPV
jgi:hypothetical protein